MNIIFLDIDGVLNCQSFFEKRSDTESLREHPISNICRQRVGWLNDLCSSIDAKVVISSTWRHSGLKYCEDVLVKCGAEFHVLGVTPDLRGSGIVRGNEIKLWIMSNWETLGKRSEFHTYAIIDDDSDMLLEQREHFFQTDTYSGLTPNTCYRIKRFFGKMLQSVPDLL